MTLNQGQTLGPYRIGSQLGAGGMGEVYRARDTRLNRDVAVKVLPKSLSQNPDAEARFEREARAVAALSHPNILAIHDVGREQDTVYAVMELLEGETLRERLKSGPLPVQKAVDWAAQVAQGLAAAHERGIVHRDLKPDNIFLTTGGLVKILDFGLARQLAPASGEVALSPTMTSLTEPGAVAGTVGYMSPEQVRGESADQRSDVFSFGCVLHEMLGGRRAFQRDTNAETLTAILREEPGPLSAPRSDVPPLLEQLVLHCLEKNPAEWFQSMRDIVFTLRTISSASQGAPLPPPAAQIPVRTSRSSFWPLAVGTVAVIAALAWIGIRVLSPPARLPSFQKLTFESGTIGTARFAPDGQTVLYGASWGGGRRQVYSTRLDATGARPMDLAADVLAISPSGEIALSLDRRTVVSLLSVGTLARAPLGGGAPREVLAGVVDADWASDGSELAITRESEGEARLEYPIGRILFRTGGYLSAPRVSPKGDLVAFIRHQVKGDDRGVVALVDASGKVRTLTEDLPSVTGVSWSSDGSEVWFSAWVPPNGYAIEAIAPASGRRRSVFRSGVRTRLFDLRDGRALIGHESARAGVSGKLHGFEREQDLSFLDGTCATDISATGGQLLFSEGWVGGGPRYSFYLRNASGGYPVRLGEGWGSDLSSDGRWAVSYPVDPPMKLTITPTGAGTVRIIELPGFEAVGGANWFPGEQRILMWASETGETFRGYVIDLPNGRPRAITPPGVAPPLFSSASHTLSRDGRLVAAIGPDGKTALYPIEGGDPRPIPAVLESEVPICWSGDGSDLLVRTQSEVPSRVHRIELRTGRRKAWKDLVPADASGVVSILGVVVVPDSEFYAYTYLRVLTELYVVDGLK